MQSAPLCFGFQAVCAFVNDDLLGSVLELLAVQGIRCIALRCAGFNNVDIACAKKLGITVVRVPAYSPEAVAEHCIALMLTLSHKTHKAYNRVREDNFDLNGLLGFNLHKKTVAIVGAGKIGQALIRILNGFGAEVLVFDPNVGEGSYIQVSLDMLFSRSNVISLHCTLNETTHHIIDDKTFAKIQNEVMLINTSQEAFIDIKACIQALSQKYWGFWVLMSMNKYQSRAP